MKKLSKETKIGITAVCALAFLIWGINYLKGVNLLKPSNHYYVVYPHIDGLTQSAPVKLDGFQVGTVRDIQYLYEKPGNILVELVVENALQLPIGTQAVLTPDLIGPPYIALTLNKNTTLHSSGDTLAFVCQEGLMDVLSKGLLPEIDSLLSRANRVLAAVEVQLEEGGDLNQSLADINQMSGHLASASNRIDNLLKNEVPSLLGEVNNACHQVSELGETLSSIDYQGTINNVNKRLDELQPTINQLNSKNNTLGLLLNDSSLYFNLNQVVNSSNNLLIDLKNQPKRYVHFSVFGAKKDK